MNDLILFYFSEIFHIIKTLEIQTTLIHFYLNETELKMFRLARQTAYESSLILFHNFDDIQLKTYLDLEQKKYIEVLKNNNDRFELIREKGTFRGVLDAIYKLNYDKQQLVLEAFQKEIDSISVSENPTNPLDVFGAEQVNPRKAAQQAEFRAQFSEYSEKIQMEKTQLSDEHTAQEMKDTNVIEQPQFVQQAETKCKTVSIDLINEEIKKAKQIDENLENQRNFLINFAKFASNSAKNISNIATLAKHNPDFAVKETLNMQNLTQKFSNDVAGITNSLQLAAKLAKDEFNQIILDERVVFVELAKNHMNNQIVILEEAQNLYIQAQNIIKSVEKTQNPVQRVIGTEGLAEIVSKLADLAVAAKTNEQKTHSDVTVIITNCLSKQNNS